MNGLQKTFLVKRSREILLFRTEGAPLVKGVLLAVIIVFFLLSVKAAFATTLSFRLGMIGVCLIGFLIMGRRSQVVLNKKKNQIHTDNSFYFFRKVGIHQLGKIAIPELIISKKMIQLIMQTVEGKNVVVGNTSSLAEAELWQKAIQEFFE